MKRFSDLNIKVSKPDFFDAELVSIYQMLNQELEVLNYHKNIDTSYGPNRYIILVQLAGKQYKFFTDSKRLKEQLDLVAKEDFPFIAKVAALNLGERKKTYYFT